MAEKTLTPPKAAANGTPAGFGKTFPTRHDLPADKRAELIALLNQQLADTKDLQTQTKHAHWNVKGENFIALHKLFDELNAVLEGFVDEIAERATALGGVAVGTARNVAARTRLPELGLDTFHWKQLVPAMADRFAHLAKTTREAIDAADDLGDKDTADLFTEVSRGLDQSLYFLEAHLQG